MNAKLFGMAACFAIPLLFFVIPPFYEPLIEDKPKDAPDEAA